MKKLVILLFIGIFFANCNDGDLYFDNLNFPGNVQKCSTNNIFYKLNGNEMLILNLINISIDSLPLNQEYSTPANNKILYRQYSDRAVAASVCDLLGPSFPQVVEEFFVKDGGTIKYKRLRRILQKENESKINIDYIHTFNFNNIILTNGDKELKFEDYNFGEYMNSSISFDFRDTPLSNCNSDEFYVINGLEFLKITSNQITLNKVEGTQTINLNNTNYISLYYLSETISASQACDFDSNKKLIKENWDANQGILEIVTTAISTPENPNTIIEYKHNFILKNVVFTSEPDSFTIKEQIVGSVTSKIN